MSFDRDRNRHLAWEELISASVSGDITMDEQARLDAHLATCAACRATADAFASQRHLVTNLRQIAPPRDLGARVRTLVEQEERRMVPWWRRPPAIFAGLSGGLAVVAGALLAIVVLDSPPSDPIAGASLTPAPSVSIAASAAPATPAPSGAPTGPVLPTAIPSGAPVQTPAPTPSTDATPVPDEPDGYLAVVGPIESPQLSLVSGTDAATELIEDPTGDPATAVGVPTDAELSPGGEWVAFMAFQAGPATSDVRVTRTDALATSDDLGTVEPDPDIAVGMTLPVEDTIAGNPFVERVVWSPDGRWLAATILDPEDSRTDVWLFDVTDGSAERLTNTGNAFAASFAFPGADAEADAPARLWVSLAGDEPRSHLVELPAADPIRPLNEDELGATTIDAFLPIVSPNGAFVIYWEGRMAQTDTGWQLTEGGRPMLGAFAAGGEALVDGTARPLFSDVDVAPDSPGFTAASIAWSPNGDAYALWDIGFAGEVEGAEPHPDAAAVYFGRALDPQGLRRESAVRQGAFPEGTDVVDVKVGPSGRHLLVTVRYPAEGDLSQPRADLILVERGGDEEDRAETINPTDQPGWFGPAVFDEAAWRTLLEG